MTPPPNLSQVPFSSVLMGTGIQRYILGGGGTGPLSPLPVLSRNSWLHSFLVEAGPRHRTSGLGKPPLLEALQLLGVTFIAVTEDCREWHLKCSRKGLRRFIPLSS